MTFLLSYYRNLAMMADGLFTQTVCLETPYPEALLPIRKNDAEFTYVRSHRGVQLVASQSPIIAASSLARILSLVGNVMIPTMTTAIPDSAFNQYKG